MSISQSVAQHLPYLRRYARALSGNQASGDAYVAATLEALLEDPKVLETGASTRIALYRLFTKIWNSVALNGKPDAGEAKQPVERHLAEIAPMPRQAFLLVALEGLSEDDAAKVLDIDVPKLRELVEDSGRELASEIATDVLIIEDETFIALDLESLVEGLGHKVLGVARTHKEAVALAQRQAPGHYPRRHPTGGQQFGARRRQRAAALVRGAGNLHHRLSGALPDRGAAGAGLPDRQAVPAGDGVGSVEPSLVL